MDSARLVSTGNLQAMAHQYPARGNELLLPAELGNPQLHMVKERPLLVDYNGTRSLTLARTKEVYVPCALFVA